jgi:hypothetical protein
VGERLIDKFVVTIVGGFRISYNVDETPKKGKWKSIRQVHYLRAALSFLKAQCHISGLLDGPYNQRFLD